MSSVIGNLLVRLYASTAEFETDFKRAAQAAQNRTREILRELDKIGSQGFAGAMKANTALISMGREAKYTTDRLISLRGVLGGIAVAFGATQILGFAKDIVTTTNKFIGFEQALIAVTGSQQQATKEMEFARSVAMRLGLDLETTTKQYTALVAAAKGSKLEGQGVRDVFVAISEAARVLNMSIDQTEGALRAVQQMISKGNVQAEELRGQLGERLYGAFVLASKAMGMTQKELNDMLKKGKVVAEDFLPKFVIELQKVYKAQADVASNTPAAVFNRLRIALTDLKLEIGKSGFLDALAEAAKKLTVAIRGMSDSGALRRVGQGLAFIIENAEMLLTTIALFYGARGLFGLLGLFANVYAGAVNAAKGLGILQGSMAATRAVAGGLIATLGRLNLIAAVTAAAVYGAFKLIDAAPSEKTKIVADQATNAIKALNEQIVAFKNNQIVDPTQVETALAVIREAFIAVDKQITEYGTDWMYAGEAVQKHVKYLQSAQEELQRAMTVGNQLLNLTKEQARAQAELDAKGGGGGPGLTAEELEKKRKAHEKYARQLTKDMELIAQMAGKAKGPLEALRAEYEKKIRILEDLKKKYSAHPEILAQIEDALKAVGKQYEKQKKFLEAGGKAAEKATAAYKRFAKAFEDIVKGYQDDIRVAQASGNARKYLIVELEAEREARMLIEQAQRDGAKLTEEEIAQKKEYIRQLHFERAAAEELADYAQQYRDAWSDAVQDVASAFSEFIVNGMDDWKDFGSQLKNIAKRFLADILRMFLTTNLAFNGSVNVSGQQGNGGGFWGNLVSMGMNWLGGGQQGGGVNSVGPVAGNYAYPGSSGSGGGGGMGMGGYGTGTSMFGGIMAGPIGGWIAGNPGTVGMIGGIGGAALGGYYGLTQRGSSTGSGGSLAAGAAYGVGGFYAGTVAAGAAIGGATAAAAGGAAAAAGGAAAGAYGAMAAIPVVGWIALALVAIDLLSGGKLFGTRYKPKDIRANTEIGPGGGDAYLSVRETRQRALFGGRQTRIRRLDDRDTPTELEREADELYQTLYDTTSEVYNRLGLEMGTIVGGTFTEIFDKKGETLKEQYSTVLGKRYDEDKEAFIKRLTAENFLAGLTQIEPQIQSVAEKYRYNAEMLLDAASMFVAAQVDIAEGTSYLNDPETGLLGVIALVEDLAKGSETLLEAYARLSEQTKLYDRALELAGITVDKTREEIVRFADDIATAAGGLERARELWNKYFETFYGAQELASSELATAIGTRDRELTDIGLPTDITPEVFRQVFERVLPSLSAEAVVEWLEAAEAIGAVIDAEEALRVAREQTVDAFNNFMLGIDDALRELDGDSTLNYSRALRNIRVEYDANVRDATRLARAAGRAGITQQELARIQELATKRVQMAIKALRKETEDLAFQLYGGGSAIQQIEAQIAAMEAQSNNAISSIEEVDNASQQRYERELAAIERLQEFLDSVLFSNVSPLTPLERMNAAQSQYAALLARAQGGDVDAMEQLGAAAQQYLDEARAYFGSSQDYLDIFAAVMAGVQGIVAAGPHSQPGTPGGTGGSGGPSTELTELYAERDRLLAEQTAANRLELAMDLAEHLRELSAAINQPIEELAAELGIDLNRLLEDLGINLDEITAATVLQLGDVATMLGMELAELAEAVGVELGELGDQNSLITQALGQAIDALPAEFRDRLRPAFDSVVNTFLDGGNIEDSLGVLEGLTDSLPEEFRDLLAPFFDDIDPATNPNLEYLMSLEAIAADQYDAMLLANEILQDIADNTAPVDPGTPPGGTGNNPPPPPPGPGPGGPGNPPGNGGGPIDPPPNPPGADMVNPGTSGVVLAVRNLQTTMMAGFAAQAQAIQRQTDELKKTRGN